MDSEFYEQARQREQQYANTVTLLGYGGFFALWATTHQDMPRWLFAQCGLLMAVSILFFVGWEIAKSHVVDRAYSDVLDPTFEGDAAKHINDKLRGLNRYHPFVFWTSTATGIIAGFALLGFFIWHLSTSPVRGAQASPSPQTSTINAPASKTGSPQGH